MLNPINKTIELADGRTITIETGKLAKQADGAVTVRMGNTVLLATVCAAKDANPGVDFMPLQVEYKEKFSAFGRFPGGFTKREGKASDYEILTSRLVDRALRPLFPDNYHAEVYVNVILFSADGEDMPDALAGLAASAALAVSDIPFNGPISECRVARIDGKYVVNPTFSELEKADIDIMVGATLDNIMMVEGEMDEVQESEMLEAIKVAHEAIKIQCQAQLELSEACGKLVKREYCHEINDDELRKDVHEKCYAKAYAVATSGTDKHQRAEAFEAVVEEYKAQFSEEELTDEKVEMIGRYYHDVEKEAMRRAILDEGKRLDGRKTTEIRPIWIETDCPRRFIILMLVGEIELVRVEDLVAVAERRQHREQCPAPVGQIVRHGAVAAPRAVADDALLGDHARQTAVDDHLGVDRLGKVADLRHAQLERRRRAHEPGLLQDPLGEGVEDVEPKVTAHAHARAAGKEDVPHIADERLTHAVFGGAGEHRVHILRLIVRNDARQHRHDLRPLLQKRGDARKIRVKNFDPICAESASP